MSVPEMLEIRTGTRVRLVGFCIYCGGRDKVTDEHVVPFALGGNAILAQASCCRCSAITSAFEGKVLRGFMLEARTAGGFPTRRPKERPTKLQLMGNRGDGLEPIALPSAGSPGFLHLPRFEAPGFLNSRPAANGISICGFETFVFGKPPNEVASDLGTKTIQASVNIDVPAFVRMLAKIGYSFAVAAQGSYPLDEVPVLPLILGSAFNGGTWVGSAEYKLTIEAQSPQYGLGLISAMATVDGSTEEILIARVKLFASAGATGYEVVVRRRRLE